MDNLRIQILGAFSVSLNQEKVIFDTDKTGALLAYLAIESGWAAATILSTISCVSTTDKRVRC